MGIYKSVVNEFRAICTAINPDGRFIHGRVVDASQQHNGDYPLIVLYPFQIRPAIDPEISNNSDILMGFWQQDSPDSTPEQREEIIHEMDLLSDLFLEALQESRFSRFSGAIKEPQYQFYQGTLSGFAIRFTYQNISECVE